MGETLRAILLTALSLVMTTAVGAQDSAKPYAFQSDRLGMTRSEWMSAHGYTSAAIHNKRGCKPATPQQKRQRCIYARPGVNVAGCDVNSIAYSFYNDRLYEIVILLPERCFDHVGVALRTTYGPPLGTTPQHVQAAGDKLSHGTIVTWDNDVSEIQLSQFDDGPDQSSIYFLHSEYGSAASKYIWTRDRKH